MGGGTLLDSPTQTLFLHYPDGAQGMFFEAVSVLNAAILNHGIFPTTLESPVFGTQYEHVYALELDNGPPYHKYFAILDITSGNVKRFAQIPDFDYYGNEAALDYNQGYYTTVMAMNSSIEINHLISIDITNGQIVYQPQFPLWRVIWGLKFSPYY